MKYRAARNDNNAVVICANWLQFCDYLLDLLDLSYKKHGVCTSCLNDCDGCADRPVNQSLKDKFADEWLDVTREDALQLYQQVTVFDNQVVITRIS